MLISVRNAGLDEDIITHLPNWNYRWAFYLPPQKGGGSGIKTTRTEMSVHSFAGGNKVKKILSTILILILLTAFAIVAFAADAIPIIDGTALFYQPEGWDDPGHSLAGLQVERGDGFINFVLPRNPQGQVNWGVHAFVTLFDAEVLEVRLGAPPDAIPSVTYYKLEIDGDNGEIGQTQGTYDDEIDWYGDIARVTVGAPRGITNASQLEMWMPASVGRDGFAAMLNYGFCPRMTIELVDDGEAGGLTSFGGAEVNFQIDGSLYPYGTFIPLADCHVDIDIMPGIYPNRYLKRIGLIPVAVLGNAQFDVTQIDPGTLNLSGIDVRLTWKGIPFCITMDVSGDFNAGWRGFPDGYHDLVCVFKYDPDAWTGSDGTAVLTGTLKDGTPFQGSDEFWILP